MKLRGRQRILRIPKVWTIKLKINKLDFIKIQCFLKDNIKKMKRQAKDIEKIHAMHIPDKGPTSRKYKELLKFNKKINNRLETWAKDLKEMSQKKIYGQQTST